MNYIGFIVDGQVPCFRTCLQYRNPQALVYGWGSQTSVASMRFGWIASQVNNTDPDLRYELYRPWRRYSVLIFLKSMNTDSVRLMQGAINSGVKTVFDLNVDYLSPAEGKFYYEGMAPTASQRSAAVAMAKSVDGVIADSCRIAEAAKPYCCNIKVIEDNIKSELIQKESTWLPCRTEKLPVLWCGQAVKLFELLAIKKMLLAWKNRIHLKCFTGNLDALKSWYPGYQTEFKDLLRQLSHEIIPFSSISALMQQYDKGGIFISPRFLDNSYNEGHTEWKITLPMARGRIVLCSPQQSYKRVHELAQRRGIRICEDENAWHSAFSEMFSSSIDWYVEQAAAVAVVKKHYSTEIIAKKHIAFVKAIIDGVKQ